MKCISCEDKYSEDTGYITTDGEDICEDCYYDDSSQPQATIVFSNDEDIAYKGSYTQYVDCENQDTIEEYFESVKWKSSDAWRGYNQGEAPKGYTLFQEGWMCGFDDAGTEEITSFHDLWLEDKERFAHIDMFISVLQTSNVFSTAVEIYVNNDDVDELKTLLQGEVNETR